MALGELAKVEPLSIAHPEPTFRERVEDVSDKLCGCGGCSTRHRDFQLKYQTFDTTSRSEDLALLAHYRQIISSQKNVNRKPAPTKTKA